MTIAIVQPTGTSNACTIGSGTTQVVSLTGMVAGNLGVLWIDLWDHTSPATFPTTYTDSQSNTWTRQLYASDNNNMFAVAVFTSLLVTGGTVSITCTATLTSSQVWVVAMAEYSGVAASGFVDQTSTTSNAGVMTSLTTGSTATTSATAELAVSAFSASVVTPGWAQTGGALWAIRYIDSDGGGSNSALFSDDINDTALHGAACVDTATLTTGGTNCSGILTLKGVAAPFPPFRRRLLRLPAIAR